MYFLEHCVKLSLRSCICLERIPTVFVILILFENVIRQVYVSPITTAENDVDYNTVFKRKLIEISTVEIENSGPEFDRLAYQPNIDSSSRPNNDENEKGASTIKSKSESTVTRFQVATIEFERVETPIIIGLWIFFASLAKIGFHMAPKWNTMFPESCLLIVVGIVIGIFLFYTTESVHLSPLTPDTFFLYMLPPIILDAGYFMPNRLFFDNIGTIVLFAVVGTIFNTLTIGVSLWAVGSFGVFQCTTPLLDMLLFSALISAVDPVAVLAVFEEIHVNEVLYIAVFGESLLNDAVTVVLYNMFDVYTELGPANIKYIDVVSGFLSFFVVALGGSLIGVIWGFATGFVTKYTNEVRVIEPIFIFVMAYLAYLNAELFHMSGILAITFCGITMKNYVEANVSYKSHTTVKYTMKMLSSSSETIIFMFLGVATINKNHNWNTIFVLLTIIFCSIYRAIGVILLSAVANRFRLQKLTKVEKFVLSYGGLRGAVAFALVLLIDPKIVPLQPMFVTTTITVIYFTVFIQGITIKPLVKILNVKLSEKKKPTMNERIHERVMDHIMTGIEDILGRHGNHHLRDKFKRFDNQFIRPYLLRNHKGHEPKILETYSKLTMKDAFAFMRRNASVIGNISGAESMSAIFRNITLGNINGSPSFSQIESSTWNIDMQELDFTFSKKDITDAKIHHLLDEELCLPYKKYRRLSYSRHAVNDKDLSTTVNFKRHLNMRRMLSERRKRHKKSHKKQDHVKQNHVSFPEFSPSSDGNPEFVVQKQSDNCETNKDECDRGITFTAKSSICEDETNKTEQISSLNVQKQILSPIIKSATETNLNWNFKGLFSDERDSNSLVLSKECESFEILPSTIETIPPWKRDDFNTYRYTIQHEFPAWASNKDYLTHNSPSSTVLNRIGGNSTSVPRQTSLADIFSREKSESLTSDNIKTTIETEKKGKSGHGRGHSHGHGHAHGHGHGSSSKSNAESAEQKNHKKKHIAKQKFHVNKANLQNGKSYDEIKYLDGDESDDSNKKQSFIQEPD